MTTPIPEPTPPTAPAPPDKGFPDSTPAAEMTADQQIAYWRHYARQHEDRANARGDYDELKKRSTELEQLRQEQMSEADRALTVARAEAKAEGRAEATAESVKSTVMTLLDGALRGSGKDEAWVKDRLKYLNPDAFVTGGVVDTAAILTFAKDITGPATGPTPRPYTGQGLQTEIRTSAAEAGLAEARKRFGVPAVQ